MYGLEKKGSKRFAFDLEKDLLKKADLKKRILKKTEDRIHEIKAMLREGTEEKEFARWDVLLHGYAALQKVIQKVTE